MKTKEELQSITTKNLLLYYKAERKRFYRNLYICDCGCGEFLWDLYDGYEKHKDEYTVKENYLKVIKEELDTRENVEINKRDKGGRIKNRNKQVRSNRPLHRR